MIAQKPDEEWIFVVDTEQYTGNFERDLVAYMTGMVGDCGVGDDMARRFYEEMGLNDNWDGVDVRYCAEDFNNPFASAVINRADDHGCHRPASIWPTVGWFNHGMGGNFQEGQESEAANDYREQCLKESQRAVHPNDRDRHKQRWEEKANGPLVKYEAFMSVACFFSQKPTDEQLSIMMERAKNFTKLKIPFQTKNIKITGFRLLKEKTTVTLEGTFPMTS